MIKTLNKKVPTFQQEKRKENKTYCVVGGTNFSQFYFNFVLTFLLGTDSEDFFK